jgi:hypothetical protein
MRSRRSTAMSGFAVAPCAIILSSTVQAAVSTSVSLPSTSASKTIMANTMLASPRVPPKADLTRTSRQGRKVPILLKKSFSSDERKFLEPLMRFRRAEKWRHYFLRSQGTGPIGRLLTARPAVRGCICACGVRRKARAHAVIARVSRSATASSRSSRSRPPSTPVHSGSNRAICISSNRARQTCRQNWTRIGLAARVIHASGIEPTTSRETVACASVNSGGGDAGMRRPASMTTVANSDDDILPRFRMVSTKKSGRL